MIAYLDASALVKRYTTERGSDLVRRFLEKADVAATVILTRMEITAAFAEAIRVGALEPSEGLECRQLAGRDWFHLVRLPVTEATVDRVATLAWSDNLRGYDAVQLAAACAWQEALDHSVTFASFDVRLWEAAGRQGLVAFPPGLPSLVEDWRAG